MKLTTTELAHVVQIAEMLFGHPVLRLNQRRIKDHWHCHVEESE